MEQSAEMTNNEQSPLSEEEVNPWSLTWSKAFPTLLPFGLYCHVTGTDMASNTNYRAIPTVLSKLAFREIFEVNATSTKSSRQSYSDHSSSAQEREEEKCTLMNNLGYGEIPGETIIDIIHEMKHMLLSNAPLLSDEHQAVIPTWVNDIRGGTVVDLGSGNGKVLFAASLAHNFHRALGIEILPNLHTEATQNLELWNQHQDEVCSDDCEDSLLVSSSSSNTDFHFICADMITQDIIDANLVIVHCTLFEDDLMSCVQDICEGCAPGTLFIMISKALQTGTLIKTLMVQQKFMDWGEATVYIQQKL